MKEKILLEEMTAFLKVAVNEAATCVVAVA